MKISFTQKGDFSNAINFLSRGRTKNDARAIFEKYGASGVTALRNATPKDSGETAAGWEYKIVDENGSLELIFYNVAHPELSVNLAMLIQLGHATRNGGYVPPVNYIHPAIAPIFKAAGEELVRRYF